MLVTNKDIGFLYNCIIFLFCYHVFSPYLYVCCCINYMHFSCKYILFYIILLCLNCKEKNLYFLIDQFSIFSAIREEKGSVVLTKPVTTYAWWLQPDTLIGLISIKRHYNGYGHGQLYFSYCTVNTVSVSHTPNQAELRTLSNVERGAEPQVQHFQCSQQGLVWGMGHWHYTTAGIFYKF